MGNAEGKLLGRDETQGKLANQGVTYGMLKFLPFLLLIAGKASATETLHACPQGYAMINKRPPSECRLAGLPADAGPVLAIKPLAPGAVAGSNQQIIVQGQQKDGHFMISEVVTGNEKPDSARQPMPFRKNLLPMMKWRTFGVEERVRAGLQDGRLKIECQSGTRPAGVILEGPWYLPMAQAQLKITVNATDHHKSGMGGSLEWLAADERRKIKEQPLSMGSLNALLEGGQAILPLPSAKDFNRGQWRSFSLICPNNTSALEITGIELIPLQLSQPAKQRSTWVWDAKIWMNDSNAVFDHARRYGIRTLFVSVPSEAGRITEPDRLAAFIRQASQKNMEVWSVDGDPEMVLPDQHAAAVRRVAAYVKYNAKVEAAARLTGMQFDIEPYLMPEYIAKEHEFENLYTKLIQKLHKAASGLALEMVVPFWWADKAALLQALARHSDSISVMDYRTDSEQIVRFAVPFLDWAAIQGKKVRIALEAGPVAEEIQRRYVRAEKGELWLTGKDKQPLLVLLGKVARNPQGPSFTAVSETRIDGSATTFYANPERLMQHLPQLESDFSAWPSFRGMALHELK